jgi:hypothetical protein
MKITRMAVLFQQLWVGTSSTWTEGRFVFISNNIVAVRKFEIMI